MKVLEIREAEQKPFKIAKLDDNGAEKHIILIGDTKIAKEFNSFDEANEYINEKPYELIFTISEAVFNYKIKENGDNTNNH